MKGLLVKDFLLTTKVQGKVFGALVLFAIFMTFTTDNPFFIVSYLTFICSIFSINAIAYDEFGNGYSFLFTLPVDVRNYVTSKYIFSAIMTMAFAVISFSIASVVCIVKGKGGEIAEYGIPTFGIVTFVFVYLAILIPLELKFGSEKSRMLIFGVIGGSMAIIFAVVKIIGQNQALANKCMRVITGLDITQTIGMALGGSVISMAVSYLLSLKIMRNKEF